jgi:hypothetical protein
MTNEEIGLKAVLITGDDGRAVTISLGCNDDDGALVVLDMVESDGTKHELLLTSRAAVLALAWMLRGTVWRDAA